MSTTLAQRIVSALETVSDAEPEYVERSSDRVGQSGAYGLYVYPVRTTKGARQCAIAHYETSGTVAGQRIAGEAVAVRTGVTAMAGILRQAKENAERLERTCSRLQGDGWSVSAETRYGRHVGLSIANGAVSGVHLSPWGVVVGGDEATRDYVAALWAENDG